MEAASKLRVYTCPNMYLHDHVDWVDADHYCLQVLDWSFCLSVLAPTLSHHMQFGRDLPSEWLLQCHEQPTVRTAGAFHPSNWSRPLQNMHKQGTYDSHLDWTIVILSTFPCDSSSRLCDCLFLSLPTGRVCCQSARQVPAHSAQVIRENWSVTKRIIIFCFSQLSLGYMFIPLPPRSCWTQKNGFHGPTHTSFWPPQSTPIWHTTHG